MKYYKDSANQVYAYEDDVDDIKDGLKSITHKQAMQITNPPITKEELIKIAEDYRQKLLDEADVVMMDWRSLLLLGEISEEEKRKLSSWISYKKEVKSTDVSTNPDGITWPTKPDE